MKFTSPLFLLAFLLMGFNNPTTTNATYKSSVDYMYELQLNQLPQVIFWRKIMNLHHDSCLVNIHKERKILTTASYRNWTSLPIDIKAQVLDSFRRLNGYLDSPKIVGTQGKKFFYTFEKIAPKVPEGMKQFELNGVDPWYAKAILLIESPNQLQKSTAGAYGPFQLMPYVAKQYGLKVNKYTDERANFNRSAYAASQLIKNICIPYSKSMLLEIGVQSIDEDDLWFKLFVMHVYNAGAGTLKTALKSIPEPKKGMELITQLWQTNAGRFQSSSQNYSQLILAAFFEYDERVERLNANSN
jgi:hypothetical protein